MCYRYNNSKTRFELLVVFHIDICNGFIEFKLTIYQVKDEKVSTMTAFHFNKYKTKLELFVIFLFDICNVLITFILFIKLKVQ